MISSAANPSSAWATTFDGNSDAASGSGASSTPQSGATYEALKGRTPLIRLGLDEPETLQAIESEQVTSEITQKDYIDRSMDAVRAQNDARFDKVLNEIKTLETKIDAIKSDAITWKGVWGAAAATTAAVGSLVLAVMAIGGDRFDGGMAASGVVSGVLQRQEERDQRQDEAMSEILSRIDALLAAQATQSAPESENPTE